MTNNPLLQKLNEEREERVQDLHLDLPIPTWGGDLVARFDVMERNHVERFAKQKRSVEADCDFVIRSVRELYMRDEDKVFEGQRMEVNPDYVRIEHDVDGVAVPVKFDKMFAEALGKADELQSAREVLMFCVKDNALAIGGLAGKLVTWMQNTDAEIADSLAGES